MILKHNNSLFQNVNPETESVISKLHYRVTSIVFLICCLLVTCMEYIANGINIACLQEGHPDYWPIPQHIMNTYCFITGTFTLPKYFAGWQKKQISCCQVFALNAEVDFKWHLVSEFRDPEKSYRDVLFEYHRAAVPFY